MKPLWLCLIAAVPSLVHGTPVNAGPPDGFVEIPAGTFEMGDHLGFIDPKHGGDETPVHAVHLDAFYMGVYDVTTRQYCDFLSPVCSQLLASLGIPTRRDVLGLS